jgi:hypothetical protein
MDELLQGSPVRMLNEAGHYIALALHGANDNGFAGELALLVLEVPVAVVAANVSFVNFDNARKLPKFLVGEAGPDEMAHVPSGPVAAEARLSVELEGRNAFLGCVHFVDNSESVPERLVRVSKMVPALTENLLPRGPHCWNCQWKFIPKRINLPLALFRPEALLTTFGHGGHLGMMRRLPQSGKPSHWWIVICWVKHGYRPRHGDRSS